MELAIAGSFLKIHYKNMADTDKEHSAYFYKMLVVMLDRTVKRVKDTHFFRELEDWWCYGIEISSVTVGPDPFTGMLQMLRKECGT